MTIVIFWDTYSRRAFALLGLICAVSAFCYGIFLLEAVGNTAARARAAQDTKILRSELSKMETQYLNLAQTLTPERARELGFVSPQRTTTVYATDASRVLTLQTNTTPVIR